MYILEGQRSAHQNLRHKQLSYAIFFISMPWLKPVVSKTRDHGDLRRSRSKYYFHSGHWMLVLVCTGQKKRSEQAETWPHVSLFMLFSEPRDVSLHCDFRMCWGKDSGKKWKAPRGKGYNRCQGMFRNTRDLISVYTTEDEPCTGLVSKNFSLAHAFAQRYK